VATERSSTGADTTTPGPPRGITLNRQNSICAAGGGGGAAAAVAPDRCRLRQAVAPIPALAPAAISAATSVKGNEVDDENKTEQVS